MANVSLKVIVRRDLQMSPGLLAAQVAHIADSWEREALLDNKAIGPNGRQWLNSPELHVLAVDTPEELDVIRKRAKELHLDVKTWVDTIPSEVFNGEFLQVKVGISIGPDDEERLKQVTGTLPLY